MRAKIKAALVTARELQPGDLFSSYGPEYWDTAMNRGSIGEKVYIRTHTDAGIDPSADETLVYRIEIERDADASPEQEQEQE